MAADARQMDVETPTEEMPSNDDLETYRIVFELFDRDKNGFIESNDMAAISLKLGKDPEEIFNMIKDFDINKDSKVSFGEFVSALWTMEKRDFTDSLMEISKHQQS